MRRFRKDVACYIDWYNESRPHQSLDGKTPQDVYSGSSVSPPDYPTRGTDAIKLDVVVSYHDGQRHLPVIELRKAA